LKNAIGGAAGAAVGGAGSAATGAASNTIGGLLGKVTGGVAGGAGGAAGNILGGCKSSGGGPTIPFQIKGTTADPKFIPDVGGVAAGMLKSQLGCLGGGSQAKGAQQAQPQANPNNPIDAIGGLFKKKKP
jgi:hypothetical protein